jgi:hypothetical protein
VPQFAPDLTVAYLVPVSEPPAFGLMVVGTLMIISLRFPCVAPLSRRRDH